MKEQTISISDFKAKCLGLLEKTNKKGVEYTITKHGEPIARVIPCKRKQPFLMGSLKGQARIHGDIVHLDTSEDWEVLKD